MTQTNGSGRSVAVALGWNAVLQPGQVGTPEMERHAAEGHFKAGSMEPTIDAAMRFVRSGGEAIVAGLVEVNKALAGKAGTHIVPAPAAKPGAGA